MKRKAIKVGLAMGMNELVSDWKDQVKKVSLKGHIVVKKGKIVDGFFSIIDLVDE